MNYKNYVDCFDEFSNFGYGTFIFDSNNKSKSAIVSGVVRTLAGDEYKLEDIVVENAQSKNVYRYLFSHV